MILTTDKIVVLFEVLGEVKMTKLRDSDKLLIIKILKKLKPIALNFEIYQKDAYERLKPRNWEEISTKLKQWQSEGDENTTLTIEEKRIINKAMSHYEDSVKASIHDELDVEYNLNYTKLSDSAFEKLLGSNDWSAKTALFVSECIHEDEEYEEDQED